MSHDRRLLYAHIWNFRPFADPSHFYGATLRVSQGFAVARCLSVSLVYCICIQTAEDVVKLLSRPGSPTILVF